MKKILPLVLLVNLIFLSACGMVVTPTDNPQEFSPTKDSGLETVIPPTPEPTPFEEITLKINRSNSLNMAPIFLAEKLGYFAEYGIKLEFIQFSKASEAIPLLASGDLDMYAGTVNPGLLNLLRIEPNVKIVADGGTTSSEGCSPVSIVVRTDLFESGEVTKPEDLKGKKVVGQVAQISGFFIAQYLAKAGLTLDDVVLENIQSAAYIDALGNKSIDAVGVFEPNLTRILNSGNGKVLVEINDFPAIPIGVIVFGKNLLIENQDIGARFLAGYLMGVESLLAGKTEQNVAILAEYTGDEPDILSSACWFAVKPGASIEFSTVEFLQNWFFEQKLVDGLITEEQYWDPRFLDRANDLLK
jgi:NitT/TauT family transport system substrate-binding protein